MDIFNYGDLKSLFWKPELSFCGIVFFWDGTPLSPQAREFPPSKVHRRAFVHKLLLFALLGDFLWARLPSLNTTCFRVSAAFPARGRVPSDRLPPAWLLFFFFFLTVFQIHAFPRHCVVDLAEVISKWVGGGVMSSSAAMWYSLRRKCCCSALKGGFVEAAASHWTEL